MSAPNAERNIDSMVILGLIISRKKIMNQLENRSETTVNM